VCHTVYPLIICFASYLCAFFNPLIAKAAVRKYLPSFPSHVFVCPIQFGECLIIFETVDVEILFWWLKSNLYVRDFQHMPDEDIVIAAVK